MEQHWPVQVKKAEVDMLLSELDTDNSGTVEFDEFAAWSAMLPRPRVCGGQKRAEGGGQREGGERRRARQDREEGQEIEGAKHVPRVLPLRDST